MCSLKDDPSEPHPANQRIFQNVRITADLLEIFRKPVDMAHPEKYKGEIMVRKKCFEFLRFYCRKSHLIQGRIFDMFDELLGIEGAEAELGLLLIIKGAHKHNITKHKTQNTKHKKPKTKKPKNQKQNKTKQNKTKQNKTKQNKTKQNKTKQNKKQQKGMMIAELFEGNEELAMKLREDQVQKMVQLLAKHQVHQLWVALNGIVRISSFPIKRNQNFVIKVTFPMATSPFQKILFLKISIHLSSI